MHYTSSGYYFLILTFFLCVSSTNCMISNKILQTREHGLIRYYLSHWCETGEISLNGNLADHILSYVDAPKIPDACKLFWQRHIKIKPSPIKGDIYFPSMEKFKNIKSPNDYHWGDALSPDKNFHLVTNVSNLTLYKYICENPERKELSEMEPFYTSFDTRFPHYDDRDDEFLDKRKIISTMEIGYRNIDYMGFDETGLFIAIRMSDYNYTQDNLVLLNGKTLEQIAQFDFKIRTMQYETMYRNRIRFKGTKLYYYRQRRDSDLTDYYRKYVIDLTPLYNIETMCSNPTLKQATLLLTYRDKKLRKNKKQLLRMLNPEALPSKDDRCIIS